MSLRTRLRPPRVASPTRRGNGRLDAVLRAGLAVSTADTPAPGPAATTGPLSVSPANAVQLWNAYSDYAAGTARNRRDQNTWTKFLLDNREYLPLLGAPADAEAELTAERARSEYIVPAFLAANTEFVELPGGQPGLDNEMTRAEFDDYMQQMWGIGTHSSGLSERVIKLIKDMEAGRRVEQAWLFEIIGRIAWTAARRRQREDGRHGR